MIRTGIDRLKLRQDDRVLDIGFGGYSLVALAKRVPRGRLVGVDHSPDMVTAAADLIRAQRLQKRVRVHRGSVTKLPFAARSFDAVLTANTIYYWPNLGAALREIARVLKPGGRLAIGFHSPASLWLFTAGWENSKRYDSEEIARAMRQAGLRNVQLAHQNLWRIPDDVVLIGQLRNRIAR